MRAGVGWSVAVVGWVAVAGCGELDYRPQRGFEAGGAAEGTGEPARDVRESGLWPGPCAETAYELPGGERSTFYTYTYNDRDLLSELRYGSVIDPSVASWRYEYDARGAMRAALFEPTGRAEYEYDARGFYDAQLWEANDDGLLDALILVSYDDTGRLSAVEVYDRNGALSDRVEYESNEALGTITEVDTRDASGRAARRTVRHYGDLSLNPVPWIHDARPGERACNRQFCYGPSMGRLLREDFHERDDGALTRSAVMAYDEAGNLTTITWSRADGAVYSRTEFDYSCWR